MTTHDPPFDPSHRSSKDGWLIAQLVRLCTAHPDLSAPGLDQVDVDRDRLSRVKVIAMVLEGNGLSKWTSIVEQHVRDTGFLGRDVREFFSRHGCSDAQFGELVLRPCVSNSLTACSDQSSAMTRCPITFPSW